MTEHYEYFLVGNALPYFESKVKGEDVELVKEALSNLQTPLEYIELHARFSGGWLVYNVTKGYFE